MKLAEICEELTYTCLQGEMEKEISDIIYDSRKVEKDTVFVCMVGAVVDGHDFVEDAVKKGASALVVEHAVEVDIPESCTVLQVEDARYALAIMSAAFFGHPDRALTTIGLTGTTSAACCCAGGVHCSTLPVDTVGAVFWATFGSLSISGAGRPR